MLRGRIPRTRIGRRWLPGLRTLELLMRGHLPGAAPAELPWRSRWVLVAWHLLGRNRLSGHLLSWHLPGWHRLRRHLLSWHLLSSHLLGRHMLSWH